MASEGRIWLTKWITVSAGFTASVFYCLFTVIAIQHFPGPFPATRYYLSVLGNVLKNPNGAVYYNLAVMVAGISIMLFYAGFVMWHSFHEKSKILVPIMFFGIMNGLAIFMSGVYPEVPHYRIHFTWSLLIFIAFIPVMLLFSLYLIRYSGLNRIISNLGFLLGAYNLLFVIYVLALGTSDGSILEWISVFSYIGWILLNAVNILLNNTYQKKFS
jgi:hypothetical protein